MQKGSVEKFIIALESFKTELDHCQLRFKANGVTYESPWGIFISSVCPQDWTIAWDGVSYLQGGEQFVPSTDFLKRCKVKNDPHDIADKLQKLRTPEKMIKFLKLFGKWV